MMRLSQQVIDFRAGLIPYSDDIEDEKDARVKRTARIRRTIKTYVRVKTCRSQYAAVTTIIADLWHYCEDTGLSFGELNKKGRALYEAERDLEVGRAL